MPAIPPRLDSLAQDPGPDHDQQAPPAIAPPTAAEQAITGHATTPDTHNNTTNHNDTTYATSPDHPNHPNHSNKNDTTNASQNASTSKKHEHHQILPTPKLRFQIHDLSHPGVKHFLDAVDVTRVLKEAVEGVCRVLYNSDIPSSPSADASSTNKGANTRDTYTVPPRPSHPALKPPIPPIRSIPLILTPMDGVAYTTGIPIDDLHKEIHLSLDYIVHVYNSNTSFPNTSSSSSDAEAISHELHGVILHETVHTLQNNGLGTAPSGLIEGIADFVRLKGGLGAKHWRKPARREDVEGRWEWDAGYERTAWFLEWLDGRGGGGDGDGKGGGNGVVVRMNEWLRTKRYEEDVFWREVCGERVEGLWREYLEWVEEEGEMEEAIRLSLVEG